MTASLFVFWILPVLLFAGFSRFHVDTEVNTIPVEPTPVPVSTSRNRLSARKNKQERTRPSPVEPTERSQFPTSYDTIVKSIESRRRELVSSDQSTSPSPSISKPSKKRVSNNDPARQQLHDRIDDLKRDFESDRADVFRALAYADVMRMYDVRYHDGGSYESETLDVYELAVRLATQRRQVMINAGKPTDKSSNPSFAVKDEITLDYAAKSIDGLLCAIYTAQGKAYFMANYFEKATESYSKCLDLEPRYLDAVNARGSASIILGDYEQAGTDLMKVIEQDEHRMFTDSFGGLSRVLQAKHDSIPEGWEKMVKIAETLIPQFESQLESFPNAKHILANALNHIYHSLFIYHDSKTKDPSAAFMNLSRAYRHKLSILPPWQKGSEQAKVQQTMQIFNTGFWPPRSGSDTIVPIFIIGFVRSGSTLLERVLDSHPLIVGTGENSVFNGRLPELRNEIVRVSMEAPHTIDVVTRELADDVVEEMKRRWKRMGKAAGGGAQVEPKRLVDKMLTNYYNVGFIQMLYPKALILHVVREPMDTVFSAFKHEFPSGTLDYTSDFDSLAELYHAYRAVMDHWDKVLPGRVTHVRYDDMVKDMPGVAQAVIKATGLPWDDGVLEFHKKKHAVNTLSTTQVRKGVYTDSIQSWKRYESELRPLATLLGERFTHEVQTTLPGYTRNPKDEL